jgi:hypothetical protein
MAKLKFLGIAQAISQVDTVTLGGTWAAGDTARITINGKFVQYTAITADTPALVAAGLRALAAASLEGEFKEITFTSAAAQITARGTAGVPFTMTVSRTSVSGTIATTTTIAATGPFHWNNAANWSGGALPVNTDEVFVEATTAQILYGFPTGLALARFVQSAGLVGLPDANANGYMEYRATHLTVSAAAVQIDGGQRSRISTESANSVVACQGRTVDLRVNNASAQVHALAGTVKLLTSGTDTGQASIARCAPGATLEVGYGATVATVLSAGQCLIRGAVTTLTVEGENCVLEGSATTVNVRDGVFSYETTSTITTVNLEGGLFECRNDIRAKTITSFNMTGGQLSNPNRVLTFTNGIQPAVDLLQAV